MLRSSDDLRGGTDPESHGSTAGRGIQAFAEKHHTWLLVATLLAAVAVRIGVLVDLRKTIYFRGLMPDEDTYHRWAIRLVDGTDAPGFLPDFPRLPAMIFGAVYSVFGSDTLHVRVLNLLLGVAICAIAYWIGRMLYGRQAGLIAAFLCAFSESLAFYSATVTNTCLGLVAFSLVFALGIACLLESAKQLTLKVLALGALTGVLVNLRANAAILGVLIVPLLLCRQPSGERIAGSVPRLLGLVVMFAAAYVACAAASGSIRGPQFAYNLYIGNNPGNPSPYFRPVSFTSSAPEHQAIGFAVEASKRAGQKLSPQEAETFWMNAALENALTHPGESVAHLARKALAIVHASPSDNNHDLRFVSGFIPSLGRAFLPSWLLLALGIAGAALLPIDRRLMAGVGVSGMYALTILVFFAGERLRAPLLLVAAPYAGAGFWRLLEAARARRRTEMLRAGLIVAILALVSRLPLAGADDLSGPYNMHALMLFDAGDLDGAERWYRRSLALDQLDSPGARIGLAAILQKRGRTDDAVAMLEPLPDSHYEAANKYEWLGNLALGRGLIAHAVSAYEASLAIDASRQNAYKGLYIAHRLAGDTAAAAAADERLHYIESFD